MNKIEKILLYLFLFTPVTFGQIFVANWGNDSNIGSIEQPLKNLSAAIVLAEPGDTIYIRGGVYLLTETISITKSGTETEKYYIVGYNNERPLFDFSQQSMGVKGISLRGSYWHIKGIDIKGAGDNGMEISSGSYNVIEFCTFSENRDSGLQLSSSASENRIINCDSYFNADPSDYGDADGFAPKLTVGSGNYFYGCRAWQNVDDGWDGYLRDTNDVTTTLENCWVFKNGYLKDGTNPGSQANGNGFKMGGSDNKDLMHNFILKNCLAFDNKSKGFDQNSNKGSMILYNCTAIRNSGNNYSITTPLSEGKNAIIINSAALTFHGSTGSFVTQQTNSWQSPFIVSVADFVSTDTTGITGARNADGSLPDLEFLHLNITSDLINAGTDVGIPYSGSAPDLGAFEYTPIVPVELISLTAAASGSVVTLKWSTATETNNLGFEIQAAVKQDDSFIPIGFIKGAGTSTIKNEYTFKHSASEGTTTYRIKQVDFNGTYKYSDEIKVTVSTPAKFALKQNYPNPFNPVTSFEYEIADHSFVTCKVYDALGREISVLVNEEKEPGNYLVNFNASDLSNGVYYYSLAAGNKTLVRKMLLLK